MRQRTERHDDEAALCARAIIGWHAEMGLTEWQRRFGQEAGRHLGERFAHYQEVVARFHNSDLVDPAVQFAIAREQISGSMEWAYGANVQIALAGFDQTPPILGDVARRLEKLAAIHQHEEQRPEGRTVVQYSDYEDLVAKARAVYVGVVGTDHQGSGGTSFLLSCSLERSECQRNGEIVLLSPEILGVSSAPRGRPADFLEQLRGGGLEILDVTGSSSS